MGQQKATEGTVAEKTVTDGPFFERSANEIKVVEGTVNKKLKVD